MSIFKKDGIKILSQPKPQTCGGTTTTLDTKAPKEISSTDMILFQVSSALPYRANEQPELGFVSAYAARSCGGTFLFLEKGDIPRRRAEKETCFALVKENIMPALCELVRECDLAKNNGFHSKTHGLPENFGGDIDIRYESGERISVSNNQSPIISYQTGVKIAELFTSALSGEKIPLPDVSSLISIVFEEKRENGGFTNAALTFEPDGTGMNKKTCRYDDPKIYESTKPVEAETMEFIKNKIEQTGIFAWSDLPDSGFSFIGDKQLTFIFKDADSITVKYGKILPDRIQGGFFAIELEMTTKH